MNLPNKLTMLRMFLVPVFVAVALLNFEPVNAFNDIIATAVFAVASFTDYLDGHIARKYNLVTDFGKLFDPAADKLLCCSALICLVYRNCTMTSFTYYGIFSALVLICVVIIIARELFITAFRSMASSKGIVIGADLPGKLKTVFQMIGIMCMFFSFDMPFAVLFYIFYGLGAAGLTAGMIMAVVSCVLYLVKYKGVFESK